MVKFIILFYTPQQDDFEDCYNQFLARVENMPAIVRRQVNTILGSPIGTPKVYRILEVYFETYPQLQEALKSTEGQLAGAELAKFKQNSVDMLFAEVYEEVGGQTPSPSTQS